MVNQILLVDDDQDLRLEFKEYFNEYKVIEAADGRTALEILKKPNQIDLVILDIRLTGISGIETLHQIKQQNPDLIVIIQTGYGSKDLAVEALRGKADDFLEKPFDPDKARKIIDKHLAQKIKIIPTTDQTSEIIQQITAFVERNYSKKITLEDIANLVFLSPKYISRIFKQKLKVSFCDFKLQQKIRKAQELLIKTNDSINQISDKIGYQNTESFIRIFEKIIHQTPTEYRKLNKKIPKIKKHK